jgi:hypothetical protein
LLLLCTLVAFLVLISAAASKQPWYVAPAFPLIAVLVGLGVVEFAKLLGRSRLRALRWSGRAAIPAATAVALIGIGFVAWKNEAEIAAAASSRGQRLPFILRAADRRLPADVPIRYVSDAHWVAPSLGPGGLGKLVPYEASVDYYAEVLTRSGREVGAVPAAGAAARGDAVVACGPAASSLRSLPAVVRTAECVAVLKP